MKKRTILLPMVAVIVGMMCAVVGLLWMADAWGPLKAGESERCDTQLPQWLGCVLSRHGELAGGLIGAAGAIIAGMMAWLAAMKTIDDNRARELRALEVAHLRIGTIADCFNEVWRVEEKMQQGGDRERGTRLIFSLLPLDDSRVWDEWIKQLKDLSMSDEFDAKRKIDLKELAETVETVRSYIPIGRNPLIVDPAWRRRLSATLNYFKHTCDKFDPAGPDYFKGRKSSPLDEREDWQHIAGLVNSFVKE
ncbi:hypothetical protein ACVWZ4_001371 [Bradyrhizobium sp. USDA 4472]